VSGSVLVDGSPLANVTVDIRGDGSPWQTTTTDTNGLYGFTGLSDGDFEVWVVIPFGYRIVSPEGDRVTVTVSDGGPVNVDAFELELVPDPGRARGVGYWKHQTTALYLGRGHAQESLSDMETYFNDLSGFERPGAGQPRLDFHLMYTWVTCWDDRIYCLHSAFGHAPSPWSITAYLPVNAKLQLFAVFLNVVSNRVQQNEVISPDGGTVSQAIQQIWDQLLDGDPTNDEAAKDLAEAINSGRDVEAGVIDVSIPVVLYPPGPGWLAPRPQRATLAAVRPNPTAGAVFAELDVHAAGPTEVAVYDTAGRLVRTLLSDNLEQGRHRVTWDGVDESFSPVANGVYFFRIVMPDQNITTRVVVMGTK
jgi:hypothetical protein